MLMGIVLIVVGVLIALWIANRFGIGR